MLRAWVSTGVVAQVEANWIRGEITKAVDAATDWDMELLKPPKLTQGTYYLRWVYLPKAGGGEPNCTPTNALVTVCPADAFDDPARANEVELDLRALVRYHHRGDFDYEEGAADQARYANFVDRARRQALEFLRTRYERVAGDPVPAVTQALLVSARVLKLLSDDKDRPPTFGKDDDASLLDALFAPLPTPVPIPPEDDTSKWAKLVRECVRETELAGAGKGHDARPGREWARQFLLRRVAVRQGDGAKVFGVDAARVLAAVDPIRPTWAVSVAFPGDNLEQEAKLTRAFVQAVRPEVVAAAVAERRQRLTAWGQSTRAWLGAEFDKAAVVEALRDAVSAAVREDVFRAAGDTSPDGLRRLITEFSKAPVETTLKDVDRLSNAAGPGDVLTVLARVNDVVLTTVDRLRDEFTQFLTRSEKATRDRLQAAGEDPDAPPGANAGAGAAVQQKRAEIDGLLAELAAGAARLAADAPTDGKPAPKARKTKTGGVA
jgi:hypothetical protein